MTATEFYPPVRFGHTAPGRSWARTLAAICAVLTSLAVLFVVMTLRQGPYDRSGVVVLRLDPQPTLPAHSTAETVLDSTSQAPTVEADASTQGEQVVRITGAVQKAPAQTIETTPATTPNPSPEPVDFWAEEEQPPMEIMLAVAPITGLVENGPDGLLPIRSKGGLTPLKAYARPFDVADTRPRIAILIGGLGLSEQATEKAINHLPGEVTLSFAPHGENLQQWIYEARDRGHEIMLELPMEPFGYPENDPGPSTLLTTRAWPENLTDLYWLMSRFSGYVGVTNYLGARYTSHDGALTPLFEELKTRGLMYFDDGSSGRSITAQKAAELGVPWAKSGRTLDLDASSASIEKHLTELEREAKHTGFAIGTGYAYPATIQEVSRWAKTLEEKDIVLVPISAKVLDE